MSARFVVMTTIYPPSRPVELFAAMPGWQVVIAGDKKTPPDWAYPGVQFLSADDQARSDWKLVERLPWNHYARKMTGYLYAMQQGADVIYDTDDDNLPLADWFVPDFAGTFRVTPVGRGFVNLYRSYTDQFIWPRGFPLDLITSAQSQVQDNELAERDVQIGIWQGLANGDPDVDAIYRLTRNEPCTFEPRDPIVLENGTLCPLNSQNTAFRREVFPLLYLPAAVTFRFTDILRGLVAQPILHAHGYRAGFLRATVFQERNPHDYMKDFASEIPCYLHPYQVMDALNATIRGDASLTDNLYNSYAALAERKLVPPDEMVHLEAWLDDCRRIL